ncbi:hypothetical protein E6W39_16010 [Kitasatospora acidiphila]|uniref:Uncharacterized protein n=1 Tax=Kitasatospora acidiphila TaxID=2567942 RepID=A0A540W3B9_9ACTN|nr:rhomboid-like protein [Kitasatospora acidiphila]TQF03462.1 hypothetical protein E6W39_16010 [Kitasatospora acidiphila]
MAGERWSGRTPVAPHAGLRLGLRSGPLRWALDRLPTPRRNPFTLLYLAVLAGTTLLARDTDPALVHRLQELSSTDGHHLLRAPVRSLLLSGLWVAGPDWLPYLWGFAFILAPLERLVGWRRAIGVFATGHVVATLLSQGVVAVLVATGHADRGLLDELDIGVSYGLLASLGALAGQFRRPGRLLTLAGGVLLVAHQMQSDPDLVTAIGHPTALLVGIALWRPLRRPVRRRRWPWRRGAAGVEGGAAGQPKPAAKPVLDRA